MLRRAQTADPPSNAPRRRAPWHLVYFALAAFDLIAVASGLYLSHRLMAIYTGSVTENQLWAQRLGAFQELNDLAATTNAPGNDVFDSRDAAGERAKRDAALEEFRTHLASLDADVAANVAENLRRQLTTSIADIGVAMDAMIELADRVFSLFAAGEGERAGEFMATMDRRYGDVTRSVSIATTTIRTIQSELFDEQLAAAASLKRFEYAIGFLIVLMVVGVTVYGHKIQRVMAVDEREIGRARALAELNEARFRDFAETASDWYWETDTEHRFTFISLGAERVMDTSARLGRTRWEIAADDSETAERMAQHRADLDARRPFRDVQYSPRHTNESERVLLVSGNPVFAPDGAFVGYRGTGKDATAIHAARRQLAEALETEREAAAHQRRFISIAAHEFRTPLTIIDGAAQRLHRGADSATPDELRDRARKIRLAAARMAEIVDRTLYSARIDDGRIEMRHAPIDLVDLVREICRRQESISAGFAITIAANVPILEIDADRQLLDQVFTNLLSNAVKYSGDSRRVDVAIEIADGGARVSVRDFGVGVPAEELPNLFKRFYRATTAKGIAGTGIGLSLVKDLVELHGGGIDVTSMLDQGSVFVVTLPLTRRARPEAA
ncbi:MAG: PAS domain S-box protein [Alphaproteobacteria bacterium]|nr:PAS domain S-box protein [Alphaproteobacteria bacterium]